MSVTVIFFLCLVSTLTAIRLREPRVIDVKNGDHIHLSVAPYRFRAEPHGIVDFVTRAYCYRGECSVPGPTLLMHPGYVFTITLHNALPGNQEKDWTLNKFHSPDTTNLHTHGLHVSPHEDDVVDIVINPGYSYDFVYHLPSDHYPGTYWYHPHYHGSAAYQIRGGLAGAIIMEPSIDLFVDEILTNMKKTLLVLQHFVLEASCTCHDEEPVHRGPPTFEVFSYCRLRCAVGDHYIPYLPTKKVDAYLVNGQYQPEFDLNQNEWTYFRVLSASGSNALEIEVPGCEMVIFAWDGIYVKEPYHIKVAILSPGARADIGVRCKHVGSFELRSTPEKNRTHCFVNLNPPPSALPRVDQVLLKLNVQGPPSLFSVLPMVMPLRPIYLQDTLSVPVSQVPDIFTMYFGNFSINGVPFNPFRYFHTFSVGPNQIHEFRIRSGLHPFHLHTFPFQLTEDICGGAVGRKGEWHDVMFAPYTFKMRFRSERFPGDIILHCHFLQHEDMGMMALMQANSAYHVVTHGDPRTLGGSFTGGASPWGWLEEE